MGDEADEWIVTGPERGPAEELLARSTTQLEATGRDGRPRLRWYVPTDAAIVLGRGQRDAKPVDGHAQLQRPSGGGAVLMNDDLLSADVTLPVGHPWLAGQDLSTVFDPIGRVWAAALEELGVTDLGLHRGPATASRLGPEEQRPLAEICYASLGRGEVTVTGRKLVGLSQRRRRSGALIQCGIHRRWTPAPLIAALEVADAADAITSAAVGLDDVLWPAVSDASLTRTVQRHLTGAT